MTTTTHTPRPVHTDGDTGRCQHCKQIRPLFLWSAAPLPWEELPDAWLCARDWSDAEQADDNNQTIRIDYDLIVWPEDEPKVRVFAAPAAGSGSTAGARENGPS